MNTVSRIYLGRNIGSQAPFALVTTSQLDEFLAQIVVPSFDGFTLSHNVGYWKGERESVAVLEIVHDGGRESTALVLFIAETYAARFSQDCVMTTTGKAELGFHSAPIQTYGKPPLGRPLRSIG